VPGRSPRTAGLVSGSKRFRQRRMFYWWVANRWAQPYDAFLARTALLVSQWARHCLASRNRYPHRV